MNLNSHFEPDSVLPFYCWVISVGLYTMAFQGERATHPEDQIEEENEERLRKNDTKMGRYSSLAYTKLSLPTPLVCG